MNMNWGGLSADPREVLRSVLSDGILSTLGWSWLGGSADACVECWTFKVKLRSSHSVFYGEADVEVDEGRECS